MLSIRGTHSSVKERRERPGGLGWAANLRARGRERNGLGPAREGRIGLAGLLLFFFDKIFSPIFKTTTHQNKHNF